MRSLNLLTLFTIIVTFLSDYGAPLECFSCSSYENDTCGLTFNKTTSKIESCCAACNSCFKARIITPENRTIVLRSCGTDYHCQLYDRQGCHTCNKNLCNEATVKFSRATFVLLFAIFCYLNKYLL